MNELDVQQYLAAHISKLCKERGVLPVQVAAALDLSLEETHAALDGERTIYAHDVPPLLGLLQVTANELFDWENLSRRLDRDEALRKLPKLRGRT